MNQEHRETVRSKMIVNLAVYIWMFVAMLSAPYLGVSPWTHTLIFYVWLGSGLAVVAWPTYVALRYKEPRQRTV